MISNKAPSARSSLTGESTSKIFRLFPPDNGPRLTNLGLHGFTIHKGGSYVVVHLIRHVAITLKLKRILLIGGPIPGSSIQSPPPRADGNNPRAADPKVSCLPGHPREMVKRNSNQYPLACANPSTRTSVSRAASRPRRSHETIEATASLASAGLHSGNRTLRLLCLASGPRWFCFLFFSYHICMLSAPARPSLPPWALFLSSVTNYEDLDHRLAIICSSRCLL